MSLEDFRDYIARRNADPRYDPTFRRLLDVRLLEELPSSGLMRALADQYEATDPEHAPIAIVASRDALYGMFRMLQTCCEIRGYPLQAFRTLEEADAWLRLQPDVTREP